MPRKTCTGIPRRFTIISPPLPPPILYSAECPPQFSSNQRGSRAAFRCRLVPRAPAFRGERGPSFLPPPRSLSRSLVLSLALFLLRASENETEPQEEEQAEEERTRCLRQFSDRDWLHPALPTWREARTVPLLPYYILHNSNSERSELLRCLSWGWMREERRKEADYRAELEVEKSDGLMHSVRRGVGGKEKKVA